MSNTDLVNDLKDIFGDNLVSVFSYGGSDHIMAIFNKLDASDLKKAFPSIKKLRKAKKPLPVVMSEEEFCASADIYPIEYTVIKSNYEILHGKDVVQCLNVEKCDLRLKCEYEIKNILIRIRETYLGNSDNPKFTVKVLEDSLEDIMRILKAVLCLVDTPLPGTGEEVIAKLSEKTEFDSEVFIEILEAKAKKKKFSGEELESVIQRTINGINSLYGFINDYNVNCA